MGFKLKNNILLKLPNNLMWKTLDNLFEFLENNNNGENLNTLMQELKIKLY